MLRPTASCIIKLQSLAAGVFMTTGQKKQYGKMQVAYYTPPP